MVRTVKHTTTPEQRRAQADALHASIADQVEALADTEQWIRSSPSPARSTPTA